MLVRVAEVEYVVGRKEKTENIAWIGTGQRYAKGEDGAMRDCGWGREAAATVVRKGKSFCLDRGRARCAVLVKYVVVVTMP